MLEIKRLWEKSASKSQGRITGSLRGWYEGKDKMQCSRKELLRSRQEEGEDYASISELCMSTRHYLLIKGFACKSGFIIHTPWEETVTVGGEQKSKTVKERNRESRGQKKPFYGYRWWWSSASIWNQVFPSVSPEVSSVQQMDATKPGADTAQIKCLKQNPTSTEELSKIPSLVMVKKQLCTEAANDSWKCARVWTAGLFLCKRQHT